MTFRMKPQMLVTFTLLSFALSAVVGCMSYYEPSVSHSYTTSTQNEYYGTGLNINLNSGESINADYWAKIFIDGRKVLETHGWKSKSTFIALPHGRHQLRIVEWNTGWIVPSEGGSAVIQFTLGQGQRGIFEFNMDGLMLMNEPTSKWTPYCDWRDVETVEYP